MAGRESHDTDDYSASTFKIQLRTATKRGGGSSKNGRDSDGKRLGVKKYTGQSILEFSSSSSRGLPTTARIFASQRDSPQQINGNDDRDSIFAGRF